MLRIATQSATQTIAHQDDRGLWTWAEDRSLRRTLAEDEAAFPKGGAVAASPAVEAPVLHAQLFGRMRGSTALPTSKRLHSGAWAPLLTE